MKSVNVKIGDRIIPCTMFDDASDGAPGGFNHEYYRPDPNCDTNLGFELVVEVVTPIE